MSEKSLSANVAAQSSQLILTGNRETKQRNIIVIVMECTSFTESVQSGAIITKANTQKKNSEKGAIYD